MFLRHRVNDNHRETDGWTEGWTNGQTDGQTDGRPENITPSCHLAVT